MTEAIEHAEHESGGLGYMNCRYCRKEVEPMDKMATLLGSERAPAWAVQAARAALVELTVGDPTSVANEAQFLADAVRERAMAILRREP